MSATPPDGLLEQLADLAVSFGANLRPGQVVAVDAQTGQEPYARAVADAAYRHGASFVDVAYFDPHVKRSRLTHAERDTLDYVPPWLGRRLVDLSEMEGARIWLFGDPEPELLADVDPALLGLDLLPRLKEWPAIIGARRVNWTVVPVVTEGWARIVHPELEPADAYARLWEEIAHVCRLTEPDPVAAWEARFAELTAVAAKLDGLGLDALHYDGPGTDLTVGLLASSRWVCADFRTADGHPHRPNLPSEEVFTSPDPTRTEGVVTATRPLLVPGAAPITGLKVRFEGGRAVDISADEGGEVLRSMAAKDDGAARLGEVALVDRESRVGELGVVFSNILLDENAASHIALGQGFPFAVGDADTGAINTSAIHVDFMIGSSDVDVTGTTRDGREVPLLRDGAWQI